MTPDYDYEATFEGYTCVGGMPVSTRRWQNTSSDVLRDMDTDTAETVQVIFEPGTVPPRASRPSRPSQSPKEDHRVDPRYRRRPHTADDTIDYRQVRRIIPAHRPGQTMKQPTHPNKTRRTIIKVVAALVVGGGTTEALHALISFAHSEWVELTNEIEEGQKPAISKELICGHNGDSEAHPTILQVFVRADRYIQFEETGGSPEADNRQSRYKIAIPFGGPLNQIKLRFDIKQINAYYQVTLHAEFGGIGVDQPVTSLDWKFIDTGKSFVPANLAK